MSTLVPAGLQPVERTLVPDPPLSDAEFEALCHAFDTVQFERTKEGVILMNPPAGGFTGRGNAQIIGQLSAWWETHERGSVFDSNTGFYLRDNSMMSLMLHMFFRRHWKASPPRSLQGFLTSATTL
jgi:Uma2 family endonuclease